ncbi:uncharacterized protein LOC124642785 [Helicoverpa zea]|uniref:uncharacterized protein LOC124642785 n=1 Tax=Helicoverpa zea TaxID=7113 RepID=UPI001F59AA79|nr:uncharacterized protein LOC124642785 [Helicoverpa zea]
MVNYCCVYGCGRNSKTSKHLYYYSLPKEQNRLVQWLEAIGRVDLLEKDLKKLTHRVCSRHFSPSSIKNKHLCADAVPSLCLSGSVIDGANDSDQYQAAHSGIVCNSCNKSIVGFRYKCINCTDYDLCAKCEMLEAHPQHYLLRIPKPIDFAIADDLIKKWRQFIKSQNVKLEVQSGLEESSSDDDEPITKYARNYDSGIDLTEEEKSKIRDEVTRVLSIKHSENDDESLKRKQKTQKKRGVVKKKKVEELTDMSEHAGTLRVESVAPEVAFADVNDIKGNPILDVKGEIINTFTPLEPDPQVLHNIKLNDELSEFLIGVKYS